MEIGTGSCFACVTGIILYNNWPRREELSAQLASAVDYLYCFTDFSHGWKNLFRSRTDTPFSSLPNVSYLSVSVNSVLPIIPEAVLNIVTTLPVLCPHLDYIITTLPCGYSRHWQCTLNGSFKSFPSTVTVLMHWEPLFHYNNKYNAFLQAFWWLEQLKLKKPVCHYVTVSMCLCARDGTNDPWAPSCHVLFIYHF